MAEWGLWEIISDEAKQKLAEYQYKNYGTKLDAPVMHWRGGIKGKIKTPTLEEIDRDMRKPIGEIPPDG